MTDPIDMLTAGQDAIVELLRKRLPEDQQGLARASLLEDAKPPFHLVGDIDTENTGGKHEQAERISADIHTVYRGSDRRELLAMMHAVRLATDDVAIQVGEVQYRVFWLTAAASTAASDGVTFAGLTTIELYAEPA